MRIPQPRDQAIAWSGRGVGGVADVGRLSELMGSAC